ncbi:hypothetical protein K2Z84_11570 [Candidatus Binatia bacterium]|nr:hypothetical protein [Candidatus Binatia bacterium]
MQPGKIGLAWSDRVATLVAGLLGAGFCLWSYGPSILDGTAINWVMLGDRAQSFLGWHFYRSVSESFPLGAIPDLVAPVGSSLAFSDAMPWFSILLKPLSPWLPPTFQTAGLWLVLCHALLGAFAYAVLRELRVARSVALAGSVLVVASPELVRRGGHLSLCAQWLIVAALLLALRTRGDRTIGRFARRWSALLAVAAGTHPYLAAMVLTLALAACANGTPLCRLALVERAPRDGEPAWPVRLLARAAILLGVTAAAMYVFGYLTGPPGTAGGFDTYSANLLTLIDPQGASRVLPSLPSVPGQYEGYAFVGSGTIALLVVGFFLYRRRRGDRPAVSGVTASPGALAGGGELRLLALAIVALAVFSLGTSVMLGTWRIATMNHLVARLEPLPSVFRASGRFVWPLHFAVLFAAVVVIARLLRPQVAAVTVLAAVALQLVDGAPFYAGSDAAALGASNRWNPLRSAAWRAAGAEFDELRLVPPYFRESECPTSDVPASFYVPFAYVAGSAGMRINSGQLSRQPTAQLARACGDAEDEIAVAHVDPRVLYVVTGDAMERFTAARLGLATCGRLDGVTVCWSSARRTRFAALVPVDLGPYRACTDLRRRWRSRSGA